MKKKVSAITTFAVRFGSMYYYNLYGVLLSKNSFEKKTSEVKKAMEY